MVETFETTMACEKFRWEARNCQFNRTFDKSENKRINNGHSGVLAIHYAEIIVETKYLD